MPAVQTTYAERMGLPSVGTLADEVHNNVVTRLCGSTSIGFGVVVSQGTRDKEAIVGGADPAKIQGITVKDITLIHLAGFEEQYILHDNMGVMTLGQIYVAAGANVAADDPVYFNPTTGALTNAAGAATVGAPGVAGMTGNGVLTKATPAYGAGVLEGTYRVVAIQKVANGGVFMVFDPQGNEVGQAIVGTPFVGPVRFTIADGSTDFEVNDTFTLGVTMAGEGPIPGARWVDTILSGARGRVSLGIQK